MSSIQNDELQRAAELAARHETDLRERFRQLVLQAILERKADPKEIRSVMRSTLVGVGEGLGHRAGELGSAMQEAVRGLDEAVAKSVFALQLALEEAWGQGKQLAGEDLRDTYDTVKDLEQDLLTTLKEAGDRTGGTLRTEFEHLGSHLANSGTDTGTRVKMVLELMRDRIAGAATGGGADARTAARDLKERLKAATSGILRGLADAIDK
jgi:Family of unknown function (DUF6781)